VRGPEEQIVPPRVHDPRIVRVRPPRGVRHGRAPGLNARVTPQERTETVLFVREPVLELRGSAHVEALEGLQARARLEDPAL
jgi:hypothetical protein